MHAGWWWIDRWRKSTAYMCLNMEEQGLYRNLLDAVWLFPDHVIPEEALVVASGGDAKAWERSGERVIQWMQHVEGGWTNETALKVIRHTERLRRRRAAAGSLGGQQKASKHPSKHPSKRVANDVANTLANAKQTPSKHPSKHPSKRVANHVAPSLTETEEYLGLDISKQPAGRREDPSDENGPPAYLPADRAIALKKQRMISRLYDLVGEMAQADPQHRDAAELMQLVTSYRREDGREVKGIVNAALLTLERLEKSIVDAAWHLTEWSNGKGPAN